MDNKFVTAVLADNQVILSREFFGKLLSKNGFAPEIKPVSEGKNASNQVVRKYSVHGVTLWSAYTPSVNPDERKSIFKMSSEDIKKVFNELPTLEIPTF